MKVEWITCRDGNWCGLETVDLSNSHFNNTSGVYVIWFDGEGHNVVRVGQGNIRERLSEHRNNPKITQYSRHGDLRATWAIVPDHQQNGVEAFLASELDPLVGDRFPDVLQISVNLPGQE